MSANQRRPDQFWATAPGKVILSGEHAVVYGQAALAAAINLTSTATLSKHLTSPTNASIELTLPATNWSYTATANELVQLANEVALRHEEFLAGRAPLSHIFQTPEQLLPASLGYCVRENNLTFSHNISIELHTDLLLGGGMGSSASLVAAMLAALMSACDHDFSQAELYQQVLATEQWQHGRSSGLDPHVCVHGGLQLYQAGECQLLTAPPVDNLYLVSSGRPQSTTGECVEAVDKQHHAEAFWQQFGDITGALTQAIGAADMEAMQVQIRRNHRLLQSLQVVPAKVQDFIAAVERFGAAGKICGAGSLVGDAGGLVLIAGLAQSQVADLCSANNYTYWPLVWQTQGVTCGAG